MGGGRVLTRRHFLSGLVAGLAGCAGKAPVQTIAVEDPVKAQSRPEPEAPKAVPDSQLVSALKDFILARYDVELCKSKYYSDEVKKQLKPEIPQKARQLLEEQLNKNNLDNKIVEQLESLARVPALENYFARFGLIFSYQYYLQSKGYELVRLGEPEKRNVELFGIAREITIRNVVEDVIPHFIPYYEDLASATETSPSCWGKYSRSLKSVILDPSRIRKFAADRANDFIRNKDTATEPEEFWRKMHFQTTIHAFNDLQAKTTPQKTLADMIAQITEEKAFFHEAMHAADVDDADFSFIKKSKFAKDLTVIQDWNCEMRAFLASMAHSHALTLLSDIIGLVAAKEYGMPVSEHSYAAAKLLDYMIKYMALRPHQYQNINFKTNEARKIVSQFTKLSEQQIREIAKGTFEMVYKGKSLREYVWSYLPEDEKKASQTSP